MGRGPPGLDGGQGRFQGRLQLQLRRRRLTGSFRRWDAAIRFDPANLAGSSVTATFDMTSAATGDSSRDEALPQDEWFAAGRYPKAIFTAKSFRALGGDRYQAVGTLTIRGVTKPLTLPFTLVITGGVAKMNASVGLNRLAFGVGQGEWKTTEVVPATVTVNISLTARRAG
ncbi:MAG: YceI family protein [Caulobacterales bacterium]|nr:YceI family protein [Caulobacterales bacterium]